MIESVYSVIDGVCQIVGEKTGVKVAFPKPSKTALEISVLTNGIAGVGLIVVGVVTPYKWTILLGGLSLASSIGMKKEAKKY